MFQKTQTFSHHLLNKKDLEDEVEDFYSLIDQQTAPEEEALFPEKNSDDDEEFFSHEDYEGELQMDVYETEDSIFLRSAIPGVSKEDLDVAVSHDMVTIRGRRKEPPYPEGAEYLFQECFWGNFSRSIVLPVEINTKKMSANLENGILLVKLPKIRKDKTHIIQIKEK